MVRKDTKSAVRVTRGRGGVKAGWIMLPGGVRVHGTWTIGIGLGAVIGALGGRSLDTA